MIKQPSYMYYIRWNHHYISIVVTLEQWPLRIKMIPRYITQTKRRSAVFRPLFISSSFSTRALPRPGFPRESSSSCSRTQSVLVRTSPLCYGGTRWRSADRYKPSPWSDHTSACHISPLPLLRQNHAADDLKRKRSSQNLKEYINHILSTMITKETRVNVLAVKMLSNW